MPSRLARLLDKFRRGGEPVETTVKEPPEQPVPPEPERAVYRPPERRLRGDCG